MTRFEMAQYIFSDFGIQVTKEEKKPQQPSLVTIDKNHAIQEALEKELQRAKKELSVIKKAHKGGRCNADEVFDYEWRVHEIKTQLDAIKRGDIDNLELE
jgi:hypothetical protein